MASKFTFFKCTQWVGATKKFTKNLTRASWLTWLTHSPLKEVFKQTRLISFFICSDQFLHLSWSVPSFVLISFFICPDQFLHLFWSVSSFVLISSCICSDQFLHLFWLIWSPTHAMIIIILDRQHMSWSYSLLIANICHDHNHYRSPTHAMIIIFLTHKIFSQFSSTGLLSCYTQFLTNKVFLFSLVLSVTWWTLLCKSLCQDDH